MRVRAFSNHDLHNIMTPKYHTRSGMNSLTNMGLSNPKIALRAIYYFRKAKA